LGDIFIFFRNRLLVPGGGKAYADSKWTGGGAGTENEPFQIATADQPNQVRYHLESGIYFELTADIDLSSYSNWVPMGGVAEGGFNGNIDGKGYKITNLTFNRPTKNYMVLLQPSHRARPMVTPR
jgi:hypothetical protein